MFLSIFILRCHYAFSISITIKHFVIMSHLLLLPLEHQRRRILKWITCPKYSWFLDFQIILTEEEEEEETSLAKGRRIHWLHLIFVCFIASFVMQSDNPKRWKFSILFPLIENRLMYLQPKIMFFPSPICSGSHPSAPFVWFSLSTRGEMKNKERKKPKRERFFIDFVQFSLCLRTEIRFEVHFGCACFPRSVQVASSISFTKMYIQKANKRETHSPQWLNKIDSMKKSSSFVWLLVLLCSTTSHPQNEFWKKRKMNRWIDMLLSMLFRVKEHENIAIVCYSDRRRLCILMVVVVGFVYVKSLRHNWIIIVAILRLKMKQWICRTNEYEKNERHFIQKNRIIYRWRDWRFYIEFIRLNMSHAYLSSKL